MKVVVDKSSQNNDFNLNSFNSYTADDIKVAKTQERKRNVPN